VTQRQARDVLPIGDEAPLCTGLYYIHFRNTDSAEFQPKVDAYAWRTASIGSISSHGLAEK